MNAWTHILPYVLLALAYIGLGWRAWREVSPGNRGRPREAVGGRWGMQIALTVLLVWHAALLYDTIWRDGAINFNIANALSSFTWLTVLLFLVGSLWQRFTGVAALLLPVTAVCAFLPPWDTHQDRLYYFDRPWAALHIGIAWIAFSLFIIAALEAVLLMSLEKRLHSGQSRAIDQSLPPLITLEKFVFRLIGVAFVLLTLTILSGAVFSEELFHQPFSFTQKIVLSLVAWAVFAGLLFGRVRYGWRGRLALWWILTGSAFILVAYAGSKLAFEVLLEH